MTNSDRLQEIRERVQVTRETYPNNGTILLLGSDLDGLLQLVTEQQREIAWLRTWIFQLQPDHELAAQKLHDLTGDEEGMTIDQVRDYLGIEAKGYRKQERPI